jgi:hypothetical protein
MIIEFDSDEDRTFRALLAMRSDVIAVGDVWERIRAQFNALATRHGLSPVARDTRPPGPAGVRLCRPFIEHVIEGSSAGYDLWGIRSSGAESTQLGARVLLPGGKANDPMPFRRPPLFCLPARF